MGVETGRQVVNPQDYRRTQSHNVYIQPIGTDLPGPVAKGSLLGWFFGHPRYDISKLNLQKEEISWNIVYSCSAALLVYVFQGTNSFWYK